MQELRMKVVKMEKIQVRKFMKTTQESKMETILETPTETLILEVRQEGIGLLKDRITKEIQAQEAVLALVMAMQEILETTTKEIQTLVETIILEITK